MGVLKQRRPLQIFVAESMEHCLGIALFNLEKVCLQKKSSRWLFSMTQMYKTFGLQCFSNSWYFESELWVVSLIRKACDTVQCMCLLAIILFLILPVGECHFFTGSSVF